MTLFLTVLTLQPSDRYRTSTATTSTFQTTLPHLIPPETTHITICHLAEPSTSRMLTATSTSVQTEPKSPDITTVAHILTKRICNVQVKMTASSLRRRTRKCLQMKKHGLRYLSSLSRSTKPLLPISIWLIGSTSCRLYHLRPHYPSISLLVVLSLWEINP